MRLDSRPVLTQTDQRRCEPPRRAHTHRCSPWPAPSSLIRGWGASQPLRSSASQGAIDVRGESRIRIVAVICVGFLVAVASSCASQSAPLQDLPTVVAEESAPVTSVREPPTATVPPAPFVGLTNYRYGDVSDTGGLAGTLIIDVPCVYIDSPHDTDYDPYRVLLGLPRDYTQYDSETNTIQVAHGEPVSHGDVVLAGGGSGDPSRSLRTILDREPRNYFDSCIANSYFFASSLEPD